MAPNLWEYLGIDKETSLRFINRMFGAFEDLEKILYILQMQYGRVPEDERTREDDLKDRGPGNKYKEPVIINTTEITEEKKYDLLKRLGGESTSGHLKCIEGNIQISWDSNQRSDWLKWYDMTEDEIIRFETDIINRIRVRPKDEKAKFKAVFK
ncbi:MAG: hypothetical protein ACOCRX_03225 [Candidatus Woesearchaeota archaeon]